MISSVSKIIKLLLFCALFVCILENNYGKDLKVKSIQKSTSQTKPPQTLNPSNSMPSLYYFSSPGCPACFAMDPVIQEAEKHYQDKLKTIKFLSNSTERLGLLKRYTRNVDIRYVPFTILADVDGRLLSYSKGYVPSKMLFKQIDEGLEKRRKLPKLKISKLMFVCHYDYAICPKLEKEIQSWIQDKKMNQVTLQNIDIRNIQKPEDIKKFNSDLEKMKYLYGLDHIPAVIGLTDNSEVLGILQTVFSEKSLEDEFKGLY